MLPSYEIKYLYDPDGFSVDHFEAKTREGTDNKNNLVPCCRSCNSRKGKKDLEQFRHSMWSLTFEEKFGIKFSYEQKMFLYDMGVELPLSDFVFWFEERSLTHEG